MGRDTIYHMTNEQLAAARARAEEQRCNVPEIRAQLAAIHDHLYDLSLIAEGLRQDIAQLRRDG